MLEEYDPDYPPFLLHYRKEDFFTEPEEFDLEIRGVDYSVHLARYKHAIVEPFPFLESVKEARLNILKIVDKDHQAEALMMCSRFVFQSHLDLWLDAVSYIDERAVDAFPYKQEGEHMTRADPKVFRDTRYYDAVYQRSLATLFATKLTVHVRQQLLTVKKPDDITVCAWARWFQSACRNTEYLPEGKITCKGLLEPKQRDKHLLKTFPVSWRNAYGSSGHYVSEKGRNHMLQFMRNQERKTRNSQHQATLLSNIRQRLQEKILNGPVDNKPSPGCLIMAQSNASVAPRRAMAGYLNRTTMLAARHSLEASTTNSISRLKLHENYLWWSEDPELTNTCHERMSTTSPADIGDNANSPSTSIALDAGEAPSSRNRTEEVFSNNLASTKVTLQTANPIPSKLAPKADESKSKASGQKRPCYSLDDDSDEEICFHPKRRSKKKRYCFLHKRCGHSTKECRVIAQLTLQERQRQRQKLFLQMFQCACKQRVKKELESKIQKYLKRKTQKYN